MTELFDSPIEHEVPVLVQLAEPAKLLKAGDLSDEDHPVNNKSLSGKRKGAAVLIGNTIYMATGSQPKDTWEVFGTVNGIPADAMLKSVYDTDGSGVVDKAEVAESVTGSNSATVNQYYGTNTAGTVGWYDLPSITLDVDALKQAVDKNTQDISSANQNISANTQKIAEHEAKIQKNLDSVADLAKQGETFTYAGSTQPSYPASAQGNYVSIFKNLGSALAVKTPSPASGMKEGSVFTVFNDDPTHAIALSSSDSSLNSGNVVTIPAEHFASFVFKSGNYVELESGYIPSSKINLLNYVKQEVGSGAMLPRSLTQDIEGLKTGQQVLQQSIDQKISGVRIQDDSGNDLSDLSHIKVKGGTIQRVISKADGNPQAELVINPLFSVSNGQGLGTTSMDARGLIFPQATVSSSSTDPNLAEVNFNISGTYPIIVDDTTYSYTEVEFVDFTASKVGDKLQLTAPKSTGGDDPWADIDLTSFDNVYTRQVFADKIVSGSQTATFTLDLPVGGTFDILNVLGSTDGTYSTISPQEYSFSWDSATNTAEVDFKRNGDYRIFFVLMLP